MSHRVIALCLLLITSTAHAECGSGAFRSGCNTQNGAVVVGPNGVSTYNKNTGDVHTNNTSNGTGDVVPGTSAQGWRGNSATKAFQQGCAWVNGKKVCN
jgi:hypothetical protein